LLLVAIAIYSLAGFALWRSSRKAAIAVPSEPVLTRVG